MESLNEEQLVSIEIDLEELKRNIGRLDESWLAMFGGVIKMLMGEIFPEFGGRQHRSNLPFRVRGSRSDVESFARTLGREKRYLDAMSKFGLDDPRVLQNKSKLNLAIKNFEGATGLTWPFQ